LIRRLAEGGTTIFVTTHYMDEAEYCDRVGIMVDGRLAALDQPTKLKRKFVPGRMLEVHGVDADALRTAASGVPLLDIEPFGAALHVRIPDEGSVADDLTRKLRALDRPGIHVSETDVSLEDVFLQVVRTPQQEGP